MIFAAGPAPKYATSERRKTSEKGVDVDDFVSSVEVKGNHRLNVQDVLKVIVRAVFKVEVVMEGHADRVGYRVLGLFGQFFFRYLRCPQGCCNQNHQKCRGLLITTD